MLDERPSSLAIWNVVGTSKRMLGTSLPTVERRMHPLPNVQHLQRSMGPADLLDFLQSATSSIGPNFASEGANLNARCYCDGRFSIRKLDDFHFLSQTRVNVPRPSASLRSCLSLVHRSVDGLIKTEAIRCASVRPMPRLYKRRASIVSRTSLSCATRTCGKRSSRASVLARSCSVSLFTQPSASSAMMNGWITIFPLLRCLRSSLFPERRWSIQTDVSARINSAAPRGVEYSSIAALCLPGTPICERFPAR